MSRVAIGYRDGHTLWRDLGPARGVMSTSRGGLALSQELTRVAGAGTDAASVKPVGAGVPDIVLVPLRGEALNRARRVGR